jgi:hypothetical protein
MLIRHNLGFSIDVGTEPWDGVRVTDFDTRKRQSVQQILIEAHEATLQPRLDRHRWIAPPNS